MGRHFIVIDLDNFRACYMLNQSWQQVDYESGDIAIIPASQAFPRTQIDRSDRIMVCHFWSNSQI